MSAPTGEDHDQRDEDENGVESTAKDWNAARVSGTKNVKTNATPWDC